MAEDTKYNNIASSIYNSSAGYIPGEPKPPSGARWLGVSKQFIEANFSNGLDKTPTGKYEKSYLFNNYAESIVNGMQELVGQSTDLAGNPSLKVNSNVESIFQCTSFGWGELRENYGLPYIASEGPYADSPLISPDVNPTTVAAKRSLVNGIMSMFANEQFYLYMLSQGYVYKNIKPLDDELPIAFIEKIKQVVDNNFDIPSRYVGQVEYYGPQYWVKETSSDGTEYSIPKNNKVIRDILHPDDNPSYGTYYDPSVNLSPSQQEIKAGIFTTQEESGATYQEGEYMPEDFYPQDQSNQKPNFILEWSALFSKDEPVEATDKVTGDAYPAIAPVYESNLKINADDFMQYLVNDNIIEFDPAKAINQYMSFLEPTPKFDVGTGTTSVVVPGIALPGASNDSVTDQPLVSAIDDQQIAEQLADSLTLEEDLFQIGTIFPGATHYINDLAKKELESGTVESKVLFSSFVQEGNVKIQRVPVYGDNPKNTALTLEYGSTIKVVEEHIDRGKGLYHKVEIVNPDSKYFEAQVPLYIRAELLTKLEDQLPSLPTLFKDYEPAKKPVNWSKFDDEAIFFDNYYKAYSVVIEPIDPSTGRKISSLSEDKCSLKVQDLEPIAIRQGIEVLMRCYDKKALAKEVPESDLSATLDYLINGVFQFAYSKPLYGTQPNWYLSARPDSKLRIIVRIPAKYFDAMETNPLSLSTAPAAISFLTCNLTQKIKKATTVMRVFQKQLQKWNGTIEYLDLNQEIKRLQSFPYSIQKFIEENGYTYNVQAEDEIEIGISPSDYSVLYVLYTSNGMPKRMVRCFNRFVMQDPVKYPRTIAYLSYLDDIIELGKRSDSSASGWYTLADEYTYPKPVIKSTSVAAVGETINEKTAINMADKLDLVDTLSAKTKLLQDANLSDPNLKLKLAENRTKQKDFVGDAFAAALPEIIDIVCNLPKNEAGLQQIFNLVFDKIDIQKLASIGAGSLMKAMSFADVQFSVASATLDTPDFGELELENLTLCLPPITSDKIKLAESFLDGDVGIEELGELSDDERSKLLEYNENVKLQSSTNNKPEQSPENAAKYNTLPVSDAECLTTKEPLKFPANKNTLSTKSNQKLDLIRLLTSAEELVSCTKESNPDIFDSILNKANSLVDDGKDFSNIPSLDGFGNSNFGFGGADLSFDLNLDVSDVSIPAVKLPKPPTLPDFSFSLQSIDDTMKGITQELNDGLNQTFAEIVIDISCELLQLVFDDIFSTSSEIGEVGTDGLPIEYGGENINDLITNFDNANEMFKSFGIPEDVLAENEPKQILSDISEVITPLEVVDLLEGNPKKETIKVVENKMKEIDPRLLSGVDENTSTTTLFKNLGKLANPAVLENIRDISTRILPNISGLLCEDEKAGSLGESRNDQARRGVLEDKLDEECVDTQIQEERRVNREKLAELLSYASGADVLDGKVPSAIDNCGSTAKINSNSISLPTSGFINKNHPTVDYLNNKIIKAVFDPIKMNFSAEANSIIDVYSESEYRYPTQDEDNFQALIPAVQNAGFDGSEAQITQGFEGNLGANQSKFETAVAPYRRLDIKIAPKIKNQLERKTTKLSDVQIEDETNKIFKLSTVAEELYATEKDKKIGSLNAELSSLKAQLSNLTSKITSAENDPSSPFSINLPELIDEKNSVKDQTVIIQDEIDKLLQEQQDSDSLQIGKIEEKEFPFYHYSRTYPDQAQQLLLRDDWAFSFENDTAKNILQEVADQTTVVLTGTEEVQPETAALTSDYTFFPFITERDQVFANFMKEKWQQVDSSYVIDFKQKSGINFFTFFREKRPLYFTSLINMLGAQISDNSLFDPEGFANLELGENIQLAQNKCDNLLALENLKEEAKKQYNDSCDDNSSSSAPGAIEESNLVNLMRASIRVSIIQMTSEAIFFFNKFGFERSIEDPAAVQFILNYVSADLENQDAEYYTEFLNQAEISVEKRKESGDKLADPFSNTGEIDKIFDKEEVSQSDYLQYMIKEELKKIAPLIDKKIMTSSISIDDLFLNTIVPTVDVARHKDENRFQILLDSEKDSIPKQSKPRQRFKFLNPADPLFDGSGGFILERYIRVEDSDIVDYEDLNESEKAFADAWFNRTGGKYNDSIEASNLQSIQFDNEDVSSDLDFAFTSGAVNKDALLQIIEQISQESTIDTTQVDFTKFVKNFQYGLRLVYIPPASRSSFELTQENDLLGDIQGEEVGENIVYENVTISEDAIQKAKNEAEDNIFGLFINSISFEEVFNQSIKTPTIDNIGAKDALLLDAARKEKTYFLSESVGTLFANEDEEQVTLEATTSRLYPVPVVTVEKDLGILDKIKNNQGIVTLDSLLSSLDSQVITEAAYGALRSELPKSSEYKLLFGYDIPLKRAMTSLMFYNVVASVKNYPQIKASYDETKKLIRSNFFNMIPGDPWWSKQDKNIEEAGGNSGLMADANNSMTIDGPSNSAMAAKIAAKALVIILKAYARQTDPHYKLMSLLDNFGLTIDGMTWKSVPVLYPLNFPPLPTPFGPIPGWGPVMTPSGILAYSLPLLPGETKKRKERKKQQGQEIEDSSCADNETE